MGWGLAGLRLSGAAKLIGATADVGVGAAAVPLLMYWDGAREGNELQQEGDWGFEEHRQQQEGRSWVGAGFPTPALWERVME